MSVNSFAIHHQETHSPQTRVIVDRLQILDMDIGNIPGFDDKLFIKDKGFVTSPLLPGT